MTHTEDTPYLPPSVVGWFDALIGLPLIVGGFFALITFVPSLSDALLTSILIGTLGIGMGLVEIRRAPWRASPRVARAWSDIVGSVFIKLTGFTLFLGAVVFLYWLFPEYDRTYYEKYFDAARTLFPLLPIFVIPYFFYVEWRLPQKLDGAWHAGKFVLIEWEDVDWFSLQQYALSWLVKGFFLPIMFGDVVNAMVKLRAADWNLSSVGFTQSFDLLFLALINLELIFVAAGYIFTCRLFDSEIRAVEKTFFGWMIAVMSYSPFLSLLYVRYLGYNADSINWLSWLAGYPTLLVVWGSVIIVLLVLHLWCDACFGVRFSNLTHRGIITNGPYRFSKHPAYVIKNLRWWLVSVPFIALSPIEAIRFSLLLFGVNILYTVRSYAEERMLSQDPTYRAYALWMDEHGVLSFVGRWMPFMSYRSRLAYWRRTNDIYQRNHG